MWEIISRKFYTTLKLKLEITLLNTCQVIESNRRFRNCIRLDTVIYSRRFRRKSEKCHTISLRNSREFLWKMKRTSQDSGNKWRNNKSKNSTWKVEKSLKIFFWNSLDSKLLITLNNRSIFNVLLTNSNLPSYLEVKCAFNKQESLIIFIPKQQQNVMKLWRLNKPLMHRTKNTQFC